MTSFLTACRYILVIPVIGCVLLAIGVVIMGIGRIAVVVVSLAFFMRYTGKNSG